MSRNRQEKARVQGTPGRVMGTYPLSPEGAASGERWADSDGKAAVVLWGASQPGQGISAGLFAGRVKAGTDPLAHPGEPGGSEAGVPEGSGALLKLVPIQAPEPQNLGQVVP